MGLIKKNGISYGGGGSGGHKIVDSKGNEMPSQANMTFTDAHISDDPTKGSTDVEIVKEISEAAFDELDPTDSINEGMYTMEHDGDTILTDDMIAHDATHTVREAIDSKVNKSGDTMNGNLTIDRQDGTTSTDGYSGIILGNNIPSGTEGNSYGAISIYGTNNRRVVLTAGTPSTHRSIEFPDKAGTLATEADTMIYVKTISNVSSLPITVSDSNITSDMVAVNATLSNQSAQIGDWTVSTSKGSLTISGSISGTTNVTLYLQRSK